MAHADGTRVRVSFLQQAVMGTPETGAGAVALDVKQSQGLQVAVAQIKSQIQRRSRMSLRPRGGSKSVTAPYETELMTGATDYIWRHTLGSANGNKVLLDETDLTSCTITGGGTTLTFPAGNLKTNGLRRGSVITLAGMSVPANNGVPTPVRAISSNGRVVTVPAGFLVDNAADADFDLTIHKQYHTPTDGYIDTYHTVEEYFEQLGISKVGEWMRFNAINLGIGADNVATLGFGFGGRNVVPYDSDVPVHTDPTYGIEEAVGLTLLDGGLFVDGVKELNFENLTLGLQAPVTTKAVAGSRLTPAVSLGMFDLTGQFARVIEDIAQYARFEDQAQISMHAMFSVPGDPSKFCSVFAGDLCFGGHTAPPGGNDAVTETMALWGGEDPNSDGDSAETSLLYATSAADDGS